MDNKIKVLAITKKGDGSRFHRLEYGLGKVNGLEIEEKEIQIDFEEFNENTYESAKKYNILAYHWDISVKNEELSNLQALGVKILYSLDDQFMANSFSLLHPYYNSEGLKNYTEHRIKMHLLLADAVIVTTERLALHCIRFNTNIAIIPNFIDKKDFKIAEKLPSDKLRVGLLGSLSHYPDYLMFKQVLNRLSKNKKIVENVEFYILGVVRGDKHWEEIITMFQKKKNLTVIVKEALPVEEYLNLYSYIDISICPLEMTEFNLAKSALKLNECAITNTLPVGSSLYVSKELSGLCVCETPKEYEDTIVKLLEKEHYTNLLNHITEVNLKDADYEKRWENTKLVLNTIYSEDLSPKLEDLKLWSIKYKEDQITEYQPYFNWRRNIEEDSIFFEYPCILDIIDNKSEEVKDEEYIGILSWKYAQKSGISKNILLKTLKNKKYQEFDIINLTRPYKDLENNYLNWSNGYHPTFMDKFTKLCNHLELQVVEPKEVIFANQFIAKKRVYKEFVETVIKPAIQYLKTDMKEEGLENAKYTVGLSPEDCEQYFGLSYYPFTTFLLERLFSVWIENKLRFNYSSDSNNHLKVKSIFK